MNAGALGSRMLLRSARTRANAASRSHVAGTSFPIRTAAQPDFLPIIILTTKSYICANFFSFFNIDAYTDKLAVLSDLFTILASYRSVLRTRRHLDVSII